jgi:DNA-binding transcriptional MerR regulator
MNIAQASRESGLSIDTIRYYERRGVLPRPVRRSNRYRYYDAEHLAALKLAHGLRGLDLPLDVVAMIVRVAHDASCGDVRQVLTTGLRESLQKIDARLQALRETRHRLSVILEGVERMTSRGSNVPGLAPCKCVRLVSEASAD